MNTKRTTGTHANETAQEQPLHLALKSRATAALTAGCLALSLCPAVALAAPMNVDDSQQSDNQPTAEQVMNNERGDFAMFQQGPINDMQAPADQQAPFSGQAHSGEFQAPSSDQQAPSGEQAPADQQAPSNEQAPSWEQQGPSGEAPSHEMPAPGENQQAPSNEQGSPDNQQDANGYAPSDDQWGASKDQQGPSGQMGPDAGQAPADSATDNQVRRILEDVYGISAPTLENGSDPVHAPAFNDEAPEIPEGEANVQAVIDSVRDVVAKYGADTLENADFADEAFLKELTDYVDAATEQRMEMFKNGQNPDFAAAPADAPAANGDQNPDGISATNGAPNADLAPSGDMQAPPASSQENNVSTSVLGQIISFLAGLFGFSA